MGAGLDTHDLGENLVKLWDNEGNPTISAWQRAMVNTGKVSQNVYGLTAGTASLMGTFVPKGVIATSKYAQFFKNASVVNRTNFILLTLQLNSIAYSYFRDKEIDKTLLYSAKEYKNILEMRNLVFDQLSRAYANNQNITRGEIGTILSHYPIFRPSKQSGLLETKKLQDIFNRIIMNETYLENRFGKTEEELNGFERVVVALDAMADISAIEDADFTRKLDKIIVAFPDDNWLAGMQNAIAGAFSGDDAYKIFNTEDFKAKMIPSYIVRNSKTLNSYNFYKMMYYNQFVGDVGRDVMKEMAEIGAIAQSKRDRDAKQEEPTTNPPTLQITLPDGAYTNSTARTIHANQGEEIKLQAGITASRWRGCVMDDAGNKATYTLWYRDKTKGIHAPAESLILRFNRANGVFSFDMPSSDITLLSFNYDMNIDESELPQGIGHTSGNCGFPNVFENISREDDSGDDDNTSNGLVAHYEFEGNANDSSGNDNNGTEHGGVSYVDGMIGQAGSFDGVDDYVEIKNHNFNITDSISVSLWRKSKNSTTLLQWGEACPDGDSNYKGYTLGMSISRYYELTNHPLNEDRDKLVVSISSETGNYYDPRIFSVSTEPMIEDEYEHLLFVFKDKVLTLYKNGKIISQYHGADKGSSANTEKITLDEFKKIFISNATIKIGANESYCGYNHEFNDFLNGDLDDLRIYNRALNESEIKELYKLGGGTTPITTTKTINLLNETHQDGTVIKEPFTKEWRFNKDLTDLNIEILENSYQNTITTSDLIKDGKTLKVNLTPNTNSAINKLVLQFKNSNGKIVKVSRSETFWSLTKTNHAPRLADGQITKLVGDSSAYLDIETYDSDGDSVTLSVEESAGGSVSLNGNRVSASFSDGKVAHTIKIGLDDGKERVVEPFTVIDFSQNSIENFYSDVDTDNTHFKAIAFATLKGVVGGQIDPNDETKRVFRPDDEVSLAEALKMVINAEKKAGLIELTTADAYMEAYPKWAMKYYTFAREKGALDRERSNLATLYPSREVIAKLIVKTLGLDSKLEAFGELNFAFSDEDGFSDAQLRHYGEIAHIFGLFMLDDQANPQSKISRAELAEVIRTIFMIPKAELVLDPVSVEQGEGNITATLANVSAQNINGSYELYDSSSELTMALTSNSRRLSNPIDSERLSIGENGVYAFFDNHGVRGVAQNSVNIGFSDQDSDGIQDRDDKWSDDTRYAYDDNGNGIPDILDVIYNLGDYNATDSVEVNGERVAIEDIVRDGGVVQNSGGTVKVMELNLSTYTIVINNLEEYNLSLSLRHAQKQNLDVLFELNDVSLATLTPSWNYEVIDWETYGENNLTLTIKAKAVGESNLTIRVNDEDNREVNNTVHLTVLEEGAEARVELKRTGWNLISVCQDMDVSKIDMTNIKEIQAQDGRTLYIGEFAEYSNLETLEAGYGYWVKGNAGTMFNVGMAQNALEKPLTRTGWNLMASCEERGADILDMTNITEIQNQDGKTIYTGEFADFSNLDRLLNGYGYWIKGNEGVMFRAK